MLTILHVMVTIRDVSHVPFLQLQGINLTDSGYVFLTTEDSSGASYQEYSIKSLGRMLAEGHT